MASVFAQADPPAAVQPLAPVNRVDESRGGVGEAALLVARAMDAACMERALDPLGSAPIDELQARPSLPARHPEAAAGVERAARLLPQAKLLAAQSLRSLVREHRLDENKLAAALARIGRVREIKADMELRDNASVLHKEPRAIRFGTLFLVGLRSDESMISVLAHELTHVADGPHRALKPLFRRMARRAGEAANLRVSKRRAEELTADLVGTLAARAYIARTPGVETLARRTSRALGHNCVERDVTDAAHLSPRTTMRTLLALDPSLARAVAGEGERPAPNLLTPAPDARPSRRPAPPLPR